MKVTLAITLFVTQTYAARQKNTLHAMSRLQDWVALRCHCGDSTMDDGCCNCSQGLCDTICQQSNGTGYVSDSSEICTSQQICDCANADTAVAPTNTTVAATATAGDDWFVDECGCGPNEGFCSAGGRNVCEVGCTTSPGECDWMFEDAATATAGDDWFVDECGCGPNEGFCSAGGRNVCEVGCTTSPGECTEARAAQGVNEVPTPEGPWESMVECAGDKLDWFTEGVSTFADGERMCQESAESRNDPAGTQYCCRCDRGDGVNTDRCWLQEGADGLVPEKDFAFIFNV